ncbi:MAG TPA: hypothetical protein VFW65_24125 [Pseudonocardiaceae bacterium]|nr:hypothetical protein [Pseudonocardiaceae bacterium]
MSLAAKALLGLAANNRERDKSEDDTGLTHRDDDKYWRAACSIPTATTMP